MAKTLKLIPLAIFVFLALVYTNCDGYQAAQFQINQNSISPSPGPTLPPMPMPVPAPTSPVGITYEFPSDIPTAIGKSWPNENIAAFSKTVDWGFDKDQVAGPGLFKSAGIYEIVSSTSAPISPPYVFKALRPKPLEDGKLRGGGIQMDNYPPNVNEMYLGLRYLANNEYEGSNNRLWVIVRDGLQIFVGWGKTHGKEFDDGKVGIGLVNTTLDNCHISPPGCVRGSNNIINNRQGKDLIMHRGRWNLIETYIKISSGPDTRDGKLKLWLNGILVMEYDNVSLGNIPLNQISYQQGWVDNFGGPQTLDWFYLVDHMRIRY